MKEKQGRGVIWKERGEQYGKRSRDEGKRILRVTKKAIGKQKKVDFPILYNITFWSKT